MVATANVGKKLLMMVFILSGCDPFYGPIIRNSYGFDVEVTVSYSNGESMTASWPPCRTSYVGKKMLDIEKISVAKGGLAIREITSQEIGDFVLQEKNGGSNSAWSMGEAGISRFSISSEKNCIEKNSKSTTVSR
jgi:hypothetical protein